MSPEAPAQATPARESVRDAVADITVRRRVTLAGYISSLVIQPPGAAPVVEADLSDGTGIITLVWLGRDAVPGIEPGTRLEVSGFAAQRSGHRVMYNPRYRIERMPDEDEA